MENAMKKLESVLGTTGVSNQVETGVNIVEKLVDELQSSNLMDEKHETNTVDEHHHHHHESLDVEKLENSFSLKLQLNDSNEVDLNEDCLLEIFSYLSLEDIIQVENVCQKWYQVSQQLFKYVQTLVYNKEQLFEDGTFEVYEKYYQRKIYEGTKIKKLIPILTSRGHHIKYYKVQSSMEVEETNDEYEKFLSQWVLNRCKNIVDIEINGRAVSWNFEIMSTHWKKLEKINIQYIPKRHDHSDLNSYRDVQAHMIPDSHVVPARSNEISRKNPDIHDETELNNLIFASKNFRSLQTLELSGFHRLTDAVVAAIASIRSLVHLGLLHVGDIESRGALGPIAIVEDLKTLDLSEIKCKIYENTIIKIVKSCLQLEQLYLPWNLWLSDKGMVAIAKLKRLKCLEISSFFVKNHSIFSSCLNLEFLWSYHYAEINNDDAIKLLKATDSRLLGSFSFHNLTVDILRAAEEIANARKTNVFCITGAFLDLYSIEDIDTPYFKYVKDIDNIPMEIFPDHIRKYIKKKQIQYKSLQKRLDSSVE